MTPTTRQLALTVLIVFLVMFLYLERSVLGPFVLAFVFAYVFDPVVDKITRHLRLPKTLSIALVYLILIGALFTLAVVVGGRLLAEARQVTSAPLEFKVQQAISSLPNWTIADQEIGLRSSAEQILESLRGGAISYQRNTVPFFSGALREAISVLIFLLAGFYLLRDGHKMRSYFLNFFPERYHEDFKIIWGQVNVILGNYLRGQLILIAIMSAASYVVLEILGVRYALILAILTGFLEIIPYIGPISAGAIAVAVAYLTGTNRFDLDQGSLALLVGGSYFILRQLEDYLVIPSLYSRLTQLHPMVVIFVVLAGGHLFGALGLVLAVPIAASLKVTFEYLMGKG